MAKIVAELFATEWVLEASNKNVISIKSAGIVEYDITTVAKMYGPDDYKKNGELKKSAKKTHVHIAHFALLFFDVTQLRHLVHCHNLWIKRKSPQLTKIYIRDEVTGYARNLAIACNVQERSMKENEQ